MQTSCKSKNKGFLFFLKLSQLACSDNYILAIRKTNLIDKILFGHMAKKLEAMMECMR